MTLTADEVVSLPENKYSDNAKEKILRDLGLVKIRQPEGLAERGVAIAKRATGAAAEGLLQEGKDWGRFAPIEAAQEAVASGVSAILQPRTYSALREYERRTGRTLPNPNAPQFNIPQGVTSLAETPTGGPITDIAASGLGIAAPYVATALIPGGAIVKGAEKIPSALRLASAAEKGFGALRTAVKTERVAQAVAPSFLKSVAELGATGAVAEALSGRPENAPVAGAQFAALGGITHTVGKVFEGFYKAGGESVLAQRAAETKAAEALRKFGEPIAAQIPIAPVADRIKYTLGALGTSRPVRAGIAGAVFGGIPVVTHPDWTWEDVAGNVISMSIFDFLAGGGARRPPLRAKLPSGFDDAISMLDARKKDAITNVYDGLTAIAAQKEAGRAGFEQAVGAGRVKFVKGERTPEEQGLLDAARARQDLMDNIAGLTKEEKRAMAQRVIGGDNIDRQLGVGRAFDAGKIFDDQITRAIEKIAAKQSKAEAKAAKSAKTQTAVEQTIEQLEASGNTKAAETVRKASDKAKEAGRAADPSGVVNVNKAVNKILAKDEQASSAVADQIKKNLGLSSEVLEFRPYVESLGYDWNAVVGDNALRENLRGRYEAYKREEEPPPESGGALAPIGPTPPVTPSGAQIETKQATPAIPKLPEGATYLGRMEGTDREIHQFQDGQTDTGFNVEGTPTTDKIAAAQAAARARFQQTPAPETGVAKEPWEMTSLEYRRQWLSSKSPEIQTKWADPNANPAVKATVEGQIDAEHLGFIKQAQSEGKPVPPEVLAEYGLIPPEAAASEQPRVPVVPQQPTVEVAPREFGPPVNEGPVGREISVTSPDGKREYKANVTVMALSNLQASHHVVNGRVEVNPEHAIPEVQGRAGESLIPRRENIVTNFNKTKMLSIAPTADGAPLVSEQGKGIAGNARIDAMKELQRKNDPRLLDYANELITTADQHGQGLSDAAKAILNRGDIPVLVRATDISKMTPEKLMRLGQDLNVPETSGMSLEEAGRQIASFINPIEMEQHLNLRDNPNFSSAMDEKFAKWFKETLAGNGLATTSPVFFEDPAQTKLSPAGKDVVTKVLLNQVFRGATDLKGVPLADRLIADPDVALIRQKVSNALIEAARLDNAALAKEAPDTWAITNDFIRAVQTALDDWPDTAGSVGKRYMDLMSRGDMFEMADLPLSGTSQQTKDIVKAIIKPNNPMALRDLLRRYVEETKKGNDMIGRAIKADPQDAWDIAARSLREWMVMEYQKEGAETLALAKRFRWFPDPPPPGAPPSAVRAPVKPKTAESQGILFGARMPTTEPPTNLRVVEKLPATHISEETGKGVLNRLYKRILGGPEQGFRFVSDAAGIPASALRSITNDTARIRGQIAGVYSNGTVYLNLAAHQSPAELTRTIMHELAHVAESLDRFNIERMRQEAVLQRAGAAHEIARKYGLDLTKAADKDIAGGEIIADMIMNGERNGIVDRAVSVVRNLLRRLGVIKAYNDIDLRAYTERLFRGLLRGRIGYRVSPFEVTDSLSKQQLAEVDRASAWFRSNPIDAIKDPIMKLLRAKGIKATGWARALVEPQETLQIGPEGAKLAQLLAQHVWTPSGVIAGSPLKVLEDSWRTLSLSDKHWIGKNWAEFWKRYDYKVPFDKRPRIEAFAKAASQTMHMLAQRAIADNVEIFDPDAPGGHRLFKEIIEQVIGKRYRPQQLSTGARRAIENKDTTDPRYIYLVEEKRLNPDELAPKMNGASNVHYSARKEAWEHVRSLELEPVIQRNGKTYAILETDPFTVFFDRIHNMGRRLAMIEAFGQRALPEELANQRGGLKNPAIAEYLSLDPIEAAKLGPDKLSEMIFEKLEKAGEHDAALTWSSVWANFNGINLDKLGKLVPYLEDLETIARTGQLSGSTVSNIFGLIAIAPRLGIRNTARALYQRLEAEVAWRMGYESKNLAELKAAQNLLGWSYSIVPFLSQSADLTGHLKRWSNLALTAVGFPGINRIINQVTALAAKNALDEAVLLLRNPKDSFLRRRWGKDPASVRRILKTNFNFSDSQINEMVEKGVQESHFAQASQHAASKINVFRESPLQRPLWMNDGLARRFGAYLSYVRQQGKMFRDAFFEAKVHNNYRPLSTMILGYAVGGAAMTAFRNYIYRRESEDKDFAANVFNSLNAMGTFGLLGTVEQDIVWNYRLGKTSLLNVPMWDWWWNLGVGAAKDMGALYETGKIDAATWKAMARNIPFVRFVDAHIQGPYYQTYNRKLKSSRTIGQSAYTFSY